jgi:hypothetical protein
VQEAPAAQQFVLQLPEIGQPPQRGRRFPHLHHIRQLPKKQIAKVYFREKSNNFHPNRGSGVDRFSKENVKISTSLGSGAKTWWVHWQEN